MEIVKALTLMLFAAALVFLPKIEAQPFPRPLCVSQFALVNYACAMLPYTPLPPLPPASPSPDDEEDRHGHVHSHSHNQSHSHSHVQGPGHGHKQGLGHGRNHNNGQGHGHGHGQEHRHGHRHRHRHATRRESPAQENCCRWLNELDDECVCDMLVRLPPFLSRPMHLYTLYLDETCNVTYACEGRLLSP
ncbi:hypothetical protein P3X46_015233 [Hevea brasiliensis]|uniref:Bifunctional inhibitor/plant lipid transfer protein/seed storage helical domain-containing protein n=1 Tax=Hevea brasiliensis TaxID=3981 RepID=A0ABQ9LVC8_HEVBR|nr:uncharacterized protein LOC110658747 [Hevea brasiliensis]KAJ9171937.1 hypothetical protein P3X46_015233 [Hevea brasiliensis]